MVKVGKTLGGSQLLNVANLPAVHYPFVLGIPRQMPCAPFTVEHQDSLFLLLKLFVTQDCSMMAFSSFCKQLLHEATQDAGHLISTRSHWWMFSHRSVLSSTCWYLRCRQNHKHDIVKTQGSASPVFPQLGLEPNHAGLASQSLFLLEELLQSKTQWHSKNILKLLELFKKSSELSQTSSKVLQIKRLQLKLKITYQSHLKITCS